jgi:hypothetical protein
MPIDLVNWCLFEADADYALRDFKSQSATSANMEIQQGLFITGDRGRM